MKNKIKEKDQYEIVIRGKWIYDGAKTVKDMINNLKGTIEYLEDLRANGVELGGEVDDDYAFLYTDDAAVAEKVNDVNLGFKSDSKFVLKIEKIR